MSALCPTKMYANYSSHSCGRKAGPSGFCGIHSPEAQARRDAKSAAKQAEWKAHFEASEKRNRHANAYPQLVGMLRSTLQMYAPGDSQAVAAKELLRSLGESA